MHRTIFPPSASPNFFNINLFEITRNINSNNNYFPVENIFHGERNVFIYPCIVKTIEMIILKEIFNFRKKIYQLF